MKITANIRARQQGSLIFQALMISALIGLVLASFLVMTQNENVLVYRSQSWNSSVPTTEAGIEDGLALINRYAGTGTLPEAWTNTATADGWSCPDVNVYYVRRYINGGYYDVYITNLNDNPVIKSVGTMAWNFQYGMAPQQLFAAVGLTTPNPSAPARAVLATTSRNGPFLGAILVKHGISLSGGIVIDSFNSQDPRYSTNGQYIASRHKDGGNIATIEQDVNAAVTDTGGADVYGSVDVGPNSTITTSGNAAIGSTSWISGGNRGVQPGWSRDDMNVAIQDNTPPGGTFFNSSGFPGTNGAAFGTNYTYVLNGNYKVSSSASLSGQNSVCVKGQTVVYFQSGLSMSGQSYIYIAPGATLTMYLGGTTSLSGGGIINGNSFATNCTCYGLPSCTSLSYSGGSGFVGTINAPEANVSLSGGGSTGMNYVGALVANSVNISGNYSFHYDESLAIVIPGSYYRVASWQEVSP